MDEPELGPGDGEELAALQEQLADARAEVARLQHEAANASAKAAALRDELAASQSAREQAEADASSLRAELEAAAERVQRAAQRYRELVVASEPALPADLIAGDDVDAVDASVEAARALVGRVRTHIEQQAQAGRVPAGAPARTGPDLSALTPEQKIRYGLEQRQ